jgi:hypothetical protein
MDDGPVSVGGGGGGGGGYDERDLTGHSCSNHAPLGRKGMMVKDGVVIGDIWGVWRNVLLHCIELDWIDLQGN